MSATENVQPVTSNEDMAAVLKQLVQLQTKQQEIEAEQRANAPLRTLSFAEWNARQPEREMPFPVFQNGFRLDADSLTDDQLTLIPKLQEGRFYGRRIHVWRDGTSDRAWHIDYSNKSIEDRMDFKNYGLDFTQILQRLTTEVPDLT